MHARSLASLAALNTSSWLTSTAVSASWFALKDFFMTAKLSISVTFFAYMLVMREKPRTRMPHCRATVTSWHVLIPETLFILYNDVKRRSTSRLALNTINRKIYWNAKVRRVSASQIVYYRISCAFFDVFINHSGREWRICTRVCKSPAALPVWWQLWYVQMDLSVYISDLD